ncbi:MAG: HAD domain-containing protein [bacterium]
MKIETKITYNDAYVASIYINGKFFKEVGGLSSINNLMNTIAHSLTNDEDFHYFNEINEYNIIFLDIDGVLNCQLFYEKRRLENKDFILKHPYDKYKYEICPDRISWLNELCEEVNAKVVISSTWRAMDNPIDEVLKYCGATFDIIGITPFTKERVRGVEIKLWLDNNIKPETYGCYSHDFYKYAIIDDDSDMLLNQANHFFSTDNYSGLTPNTCYKIRRFFTHKTI